MIKRLKEAFISGVITAIIWAAYLGIRSLIGELPTTWTDNMFSPSSTIHPYLPWVDIPIIGGIVFCVDFLLSKGEKRRSQKQLILYILGGNALGAFFIWEEWWRFLVNWTIAAILIVDRIRVMTQVIDTQNSAIRNYFWGATPQGVKEDERGYHLALLFGLIIPFLFINGGIDAANLMFSAGLLLVLVHLLPFALLVIAGFGLIPFLFGVGMSVYFPVANRTIGETEETVINILSNIIN